MSIFKTKHLVFYFEKHLKYKEKYLGKVKNKRGHFLGMIDYQPQWKEHIFQPEFDCDFSYECMRDLANVLSNLNQGRIAALVPVESGVK